MATSNLKRAIISPASGIVNEPGYDFSLFTTSDLTPSTSVPAQAAQQGDVILWPGFTKGIGFSGFPAMLAEAVNHPNIKYVYVYDEVFWNGTAIQMGLDEVAINQAADQAHAAGLQTVITILPDVILDPAFAMTAINKFDVISIDVYPTIRPTSTVGNYPNIYPNILSDLLYSSIQRLRQLGFLGRIWYIYQAFGMHSKTDFELTSAFDLQIETLNACEAMGVEGIVPFGFWLGPDEISREPDLFQGYGTGYEIQLRYPPVVQTPLIDATFALTDAGILAVSNATPTGPAIKIVAFKLGDKADQPPSHADTDLAGNVVYSGVPSSFSFYDEQTIQLNMEVPATAGPFMYGELGLYLANDVLFARYSYGQLQVKTASPTGAIANTLRINALMRIAQGNSGFHILPGTTQTVIELSSLSLLNTPTSYPENPVVIVHEPNDFQESILLYRNESTLWSPANYSRIGTALITAATDVLHLTADYFGTLYLPPNNLGRFIIQTAGGFMRTITAFTGKVASLAQQMDTAPLVGQLVAVYELNTGAFADLYASVTQLQASTANAHLYLGLTQYIPAPTSGLGGPPGDSYYLVAQTLTSCPDVFAVTFDSVCTPPMRMAVGTLAANADGPLLDANGLPIAAGLISANETRTVIHANGNFYVQDSPAAAVSGVSSVNTRTGAVSIIASDVTAALGYTAYDAANPSGFIPGSSTLTLTGEVTATATQLNAGSIATTISNAAVLGKQLTGYVVGSGTVSSTDTILSAIEKLAGNIAASGSGTVTSVSVTPANGVSGVVATPGTTPAITLSLGNITPTSVAATGTVTGSNLSGTNTGDQTITLTGAVTGSGSGSFVTTLANSGVTAGTYQSVTVNAKGIVTVGAALASTDVTTALGYTPLNKAGDTMSGNLTMSGNSIVSPLLRGTREFRDSVAIASGVLALDLTSAITSVTLNANITSITFANNNASSTSCMSHQIEFTGDGTQRTVVWPSGNGSTTLKVVFPGGTPPTLTATSGKRDTIGLKSVSQFLWDAYVIGQNS